MPVLPGDPEVRVEPTRRIRDGESYNLSTITLGSHAGTHLDPPLHLIDGAPAVDEIDLDLLSGPALVVEVPPGTRSIGPAIVDRIPEGTERVLFRTENSERWAAGSGYFEPFVAIDPGGADALLLHGVGLVGIDALSVEAPDDPTLPIHRAFLGAGVVLLEGLVLAEAPPGRYDLVCLPIRIAGGDGAPCRAVLRPPPGSGDLSRARPAGAGRGSRR